MIFEKKCRIFFVEQGISFTTDGFLKYITLEFSKMNGHACRTTPVTQPVKHDI